MKFVKLTQSIALVCALLFLNPTNLSAEENWGFVCDKDTVYSLFDESDIIGANPENGQIIFTTRTAKVDKKNKTVKIWELHIATPQHKNSLMQDYGNQYAKYGYKKRLSIYDIENDRLKLLSLVYYTCNGSTIDSFNYENPKWDNIIPGSVGEYNMLLLKKHFGL